MCRFFFQAEDGIRDIGVTGVQTCALPIFDIRLDFAPGGQGKGRIAMLTGTGAFASRLQRMKAYRNLVERCGWGDASRHPMTGDASVIRSYERLVKHFRSPAMCGWRWLH